MFSTKLVPLPCLAMLSCALSACGGSFTTPSATDIWGSYPLVSANGQSLPAVVSGNASTGSVQEVTGGLTELRADQTFTWRTDYRNTNSGRTTTSTSSGSGRYSLTGSAITFTYEPGSEQLSGTLSDGVVTVRADVELVYRK